MGQASTSVPLVGHGTALCLSPANSATGAPLLPGADELPVRGTETILLVEDQIFVREVTGKILRSAGYSVLVAKSAEEGLSTYDLAKGRVDLVVTDVILPGEDGRQLARKLRRQDPLLRVLLITGYAEQMVKSGSEPEFGKWLPKPFSTFTLLQRVREVLDELLNDPGPDLRNGACAIEGQEGYRGARRDDAEKQSFHALR